jgi:hypothetical protein
MLHTQRDAGPSRAFEDMQAENDRKIAQGFKALSDGMSSMEQRIVSQVHQGLMQSLQALFGAGFQAPAAGAPPPPAGQ